MVGASSSASPAAEAIQGCRDVLVTCQLSSTRSHQPPGSVYDGHVTRTTSINVDESAIHISLVAGRLA